MDERMVGLIDKVVRLKLKVLDLQSKVHILRVENRELRQRVAELDESAGLMYWSKDVGGRIH